MTNIIRSQWFTVTNNKKELLLYILGCLFPLGLTFTECTDGITFSGYICNSQLSILVSTAIAAVLVSTSFVVKLANYEIMAGYSAHAIVSARFLLGAVISFVTYYIPVFLILAINDLSSLTAENMLIVFLCWLKMYMFLAGMCILFKHFAGAIIAMIIYSFETLPVLFLQYLIGKDMSFIATWFSATQLGMLGAMEKEPELFLVIPESNDGLLLKVFISTMVICVVMYYLSYISVKNKWLADQPAI